MCNYSDIAIFAITPTAATVDAGGAIPISTIARRITPAIQLGSDSLNVAVPGYYKLDATVTFTAPAAGDVTITAQASGVDIPGITATETVTTADTEIRTISLTGLIRVRCEPLALSLVNSGVAIATSNVAVTLERID